MAPLSVIKKCRVCAKKPQALNRFGMCDTCSNFYSYTDIIDFERWIDFFYGRRHGH